MSAKPAVLITGATGLVGSRITELLADRYQFFNLDLTTGVDITQIDKIRQFVAQHPAEVMIHLAAFTNVQACFEQTNDKSGLAYQVNVEGTANIARVCQENNIYLVHVSTDFVFAGDTKEPYTEEAQRNPIEWYGQTKTWAEEKIEEILDNYAIVRIGFPYRAKFPDKPGIVAKIRQGLTNGELQPQFGDMTITPTFIDDLAEAIAVIIEKRPQGIFHLHGSSSLSPYELAKKIAAAFNFNPDLVKQGSLEEYLKTTKRPYQKHLIMANEKAKNELGVRLRTIDEGLAAIKKQLNQS